MAEHPSYKPPEQGKYIFTNPHANYKNINNISNNIKPNKTSNRKFNQNYQAQSLKNAHYPQDSNIINDNYSKNKPNLNNYNFNKYSPMHISKYYQQNYSSNIYKDSSKNSQIAHMHNTTKADYDQSEVQGNFHNRNDYNDNYHRKNRQETNHHPLNRIRTMNISDVKEFIPKSLLNSDKYYQN